MVLLKVKVREDDQFLYRTSNKTSVETIRKTLVELHNLRQTIRRLKIDGEELAKHGPAKHPSARGIDTYSEEQIEKSEYYEIDPSGRRNGNGCNPMARDTLLKTLCEANELIHKSQVAVKNEVTVLMLKEAIDNIRGAVLICYPMGLPEWDPVRLLLENKHDVSDSYGYEHFEVEETMLWFAGKELMPGNLLSKHLGSTESTTAIIRLTKKSQGAPSREPVVDEDTYKGMMSWAYKKQEEQKALSENQEDVYLESEWASTNSLKQHLSGISRIRI